MPPSLDEKQFINYSISEIKSFIERYNYDENIIKDLLSDHRTGVRALAKKLQNRKRRSEQLRLKHDKMLAIEKNLHTEGITTIAGIDEAGRGPLAGPVVAACVILPENPCLEGLDDSKKMTPKSRDEMFGRIIEVAEAWGIGMADNDEIDEIGILEAAMTAMRRAVENIKKTPDIALIDGNKTPGLNCRERAIINGDALSLSIAAASVIAKVTRDRIMIEMDGMFPGYGFARHKGYGSSAHVNAICELGPCYIHRLSFKIVPASAPKGTSSAILKKRLINAQTREAFDRAASGIARIRHILHESDIEALRKTYKVCKSRFSEAE